MDIDEIIKGLQDIVNDNWMWRNADRYAMVCDNALALIKEHKVRLLTEKEIQRLDEGQFIWIQLKSGDLYCLQIIGMCGLCTGKYTDIQFNAPTSFPELNIGMYKKTWVAWTAQPTVEQCDEVKWE